jgi:hypothetical protein
MFDLVRRAKAMKLYILSTRLLFSASALLWLLVAAEEVGATISAPAPVRKRDDPITDRTDFFGWISGYDHTCELSEKHDGRALTLTSSPSVRDPEVLF